MTSRTERHQLENDPLAGPATRSTGAGSSSMNQISAALIKPGIPAM